MQILTGAFLKPLGLPPWHWAHPGKKGKSFPGFLLLQCTPPALSPPPHFSTSGSSRAWNSCSWDSHNPRCHHSCCSQRRCPLCLPLNLGSCLFFPARASGCLLLGSAHPLGSTVRLRDPAQGRQTGLRTSVLPWRTGSRKRRYETEPLPLACPLLPAASDPPVSLSVRLQSLQTLSLCQLSPSLPGH